METGTITAINPEGFGFIAPDRHAGEIWIRPGSFEVPARLPEGQRVEYAIRVGDLGVEAANIRAIGH